MKYAIFLLICLTSLSCSNSYSDELSSKIDSLYETYSSNEDEYGVIKDSVAKELKKNINLIIETYGIVGLDNASEEDYYHFWEIYQRLDFKAEEQTELLKRMKSKVDSEAFDSETFAFITDNYYLKQNKQQIYGTQLNFDSQLKKVTPKNLKAPNEVDLRREEIGLKPMNEYLAEMTELHFGK